MATPPPMSRASSQRAQDGPVDLHHPTPDLQSLQGAYVSNIERLEDHAERMSEHGSDLGEEIRKLQLEQKLSDSRNSSLRSPPPMDDVQRAVSSRSRGASTSSYSNSIVDVNSNARWGGYSPGGYVTSPVGSLRSAPSLSHQTPLQRQRSGSKASRLGQIVHAEEHDDDMDDDEQPFGSPRSHMSSHAAARRKSSPPASRRSVSSFTQKYDQITQEIQDELQSTVQASEMLQVPGNDHDYSHMPDRPPTAASTDTSRQARNLWHDFDGAHCSDAVPEGEPMPEYTGGSRESALLKLGSHEAPEPGAPPPADDMVFYPAPVPQLLNLPKRLSKLPAANVQARRRTQLLESMQSENRKSGAWLAEHASEPSKPSRKSRQDLSKLPPQLRASAYFDQAAPAQEVEVRGESAQDTLESILAASAHAPVSAFTDHPIAGHVGNEVYGKEKHTRTGSKANDIDKVDTKKNRRSSFNLLNTRRNSSGDLLKKLKKRNSSADLNMLTVRANESRVSSGNDLDDTEAGAESHDFGHNDTTPTRRSFDQQSHHDGEDRDEEEGEHDGEEGEEADEPQYFGAPTTLLAELEMRKNQQKKRNLTAATAFPQGMHATLLQMDAVAEVNKNKRKNQKVNLAWEAVPLNDDDQSSDDEVPLGVLYPERNGLINKKSSAGPRQTGDWERPLGLIAQREMEDHEPLSKRRTRLLGVDSIKLGDMGPAGNRQTVLREPSPSQQFLTIPTSGSPQLESDGEGDGETLAQRIRRLKDRQALDSALGDDIRKSTVSGDFASEMLGQLGVSDEDKSKPSPSPGEEETLGQRRARLQAEALARGDVNPLGNRPPLRASMSMANILSAHPIDNTNQARKVSDEQLLNSLPQGSLLHKNAMEKSRKDADRIKLNHRISSYTLDQPLLGKGMGKATPEQAIAGRIQAYKDNINNVGTPQTAPLPGMMPGRSSMMFNPMGMGAMNMSSMNLAGQRDSYFPQAMGMGMPNMAPNFIYPGANMVQQPMMGMNMGMMGMPMNGMQPMSNPYGQMGGMRNSSMMSLSNPMQMQSQMMMMDAPMDPRQRDMIDRWRNGVA